MQRFKNILYILDAETDQEAVVAEKVRNLARLNKAKVCVVRIVEEGLFEQFGLVLSPRLAEAAEAARQQAGEEVAAFIDDSAWQGIEVTSSLLVGKGFIAAIQKVLRDGHDLIVKGGNPGSGVDQLAMRLFRKCPCPVWVIRRTPSGDFRRILAAVDVDARHEETEALNTKVLQLAHSLAQRERGEAHYLHAWRLEHELMLHGPRFNLSLEEILDMKKELRQRRSAQLAGLLERNAIEAEEATLHLIEGETSEAIEHAIEELEVDVLIMGTIARSGVPGMLIGNQAEEVLSRIECSVLAVKPDGFVSPVSV